MVGEIILPTPCTKVEEKTARDWFQKINEELDELKDRIASSLNSPDILAENVFNIELFMYKRDDLLQIWQMKKERIAEEAADTITAITSMLEAMGIDANMRQEAQRRVNEKNRERGRF